MGEKDNDGDESKMSEDEEDSGSDEEVRRVGSCEVKRGD